MSIVLHAFHIDLCRLCHTHFISNYVDCVVHMFIDWCRLCLTHFISISIDCVAYFLLTCVDCVAHISYRFMSIVLHISCWLVSVPSLGKSVYYVLATYKICSIKRWPKHCLAFKEQFHCRKMYLLKPLEDIISLFQSSLLFPFQAQKILLKTPWERLFAKSSFFPSCTQNLTFIFFHHFSSIFHFPHLPSIKFPL